MGLFSRKKDIPLTEKLLSTVRWALDEGMDPSEAHAALVVTTIFLFKSRSTDFYDEGMREKMVKANAEVFDHFMKKFQECRAAP